MEYHQAPSSSELELHKEKIIRLYIIEKRTLRDVMDTLWKEDGCKASSNMYLKQIRKWQAKKNTTYPYPEMLSFLRDIKIRKAEGKPPITKYVGGSLMREAEAAAYFRRKFGYDSLEIAISSLLKPRSKRRYGEFSGDLIIPKQVTLPDTHSQATQFFHLIHIWQAQILVPFTFPKGALAGQLQEEDESVQSVQQLRRTYLYGPPNTTMQMVHDYFLHGLDLISRGRSKAGFAAVNHAFANIRELLLLSHPHLLINLLICILVTLEYNHAQLGKILAEQIAGHARILYGRDHVLTQWASLLLQGFDNMGLVSWGMQVSYDATTKCLSKVDSLSLSQRNTLYNAGVGMSGLTFEELSHRYEEAIEEQSTIKNVSSETNFSGLIYSKICYADILRKHGYLARAEQINADVPELLNKEDLSERQFKAVVLAFVEYIATVVEQGPEHYQRAEQMLERGLSRVRNRLPAEDQNRLMLESRAINFHEQFSKKIDKDTAENLQDSLLEPLTALEI